MLELGETLRSGAAREALEETGLVVEVGEALDMFDRIVHDVQGRIQFHYVLIDFLCRRVSGELRAGGDALEVRWISAQELGRFPIADSAAGVITKGLEAAAALKAKPVATDVRG
jgi:ADP-ribose pyrophosphatase YjhB (NUDIX family)